MITLATFSTPEEAHLFRARLEAGGIPAFVQDECLVQMDWLYSNAVGGVRVQVADEDAEAARAFLADDLPEGAPVEVACPKCGSDQTAPDERPRRFAFLAILLLGLPLLFGRHRWRCRACHHAWTAEPRGPSYFGVIFPSYLVVLLLLVVGGAVLLVVGTMLNGLLALFAVFGILIFLGMGRKDRSSEADQKTD